MIEAVGLTKRYGAKTAVYNLSFQVRPGTVTGFLGPNGSGKSTTMRMILGLDRPTAGHVTIGGHPFRRLPNAPRQVGALLDAKAVHGGRSARNHLLCLAQLSGIPAAPGRRGAGRRRPPGRGAASAPGASPSAWGSGSGIAAALLGDPQVLLFDEPVNGLDPEGILWVRNLMKQLASEGRTVFVSSHLMSEMALTADHLIVIGRGQLLADMSVKDFISHNSADFARVRRRDSDPRQREKLTAALREAGGQVMPEQDGALRVTGLPLPRISDLAHDVGRTAVGALPAPGVAGGGVHADDAGRRGLPLDGRPARRPRQPPPPGYGSRSRAGRRARGPAGLVRAAAARGRTAVRARRAPPGGPPAARRGARAGARAPQARTPRSPPAPRPDLARRRKRRGSAPPTRDDRHNREDAR